MHSMMRGFGGPFAGGLDAIEDARGRRRQEPQRGERSVDPFEQMSRQMNGMMQHFGRGMMDFRMPNMDAVGGNNAHCYSHSSVYSYSNDGQGAPKMFQAASEERRGPGGVRETKKAVKDSESGVQKMAVGHHLGDRGHVVERSQNLRSGERGEKQDFIGLTENDGAAFNEEWTHATRTGNHRHRRHVEENGERRPRQALPDARPHQRRHPRDHMLMDV